MKGRRKLMLSGGLSAGTRTRLAESRKLCALEGWAAAPQGKGAAEAGRQAALRKRHPEDWARRQHDALEDNSPVPGAVFQRVRDTHPLRLYRKRGWISEAELQAGERLLGRWTLAQARAVRVQSWSVRVQQDGHGRLDVEALDALAWVRAALAAVAPELSYVLLRVVVESSPARMVCGEMGLNERAGVDLLRVALWGLQRFERKAA